ncbi:plasmid mobilization relaxosome protein MobC [Sphingomonas solaris]|uniref:MobC family plasmid mobilization relaxosome protein n=1 Tax=Alterirhizorhabdus solaris TaxID=2529389 RepID=A0A558QXG5_9SPHN|nr:plasmid mobilization relaxosome protein MobC [Sphingomonas solaris]TVV71853.1 MobC family plasmid mobilization relaxosome protein [Sphingomonas solaris]
MPSSVTRPAPFSLRLTPEDRARLNRDAAGMPLGAYIRWRLFDPANPPPRLRGKFPVKDHQAVSALLGKLGSTRIANNLNQLARAAHSGSLVLTPDIEAELHQAAADIAAMRDLLITALGLADAARAEDAP